jgi:hypothetical protein
MRKYFGSRKFKAYPHGKCTGRREANTKMGIKDVGCKGVGRMHQTQNRVGPSYGPL